MIYRDCFSLMLKCHLKKLGKILRFIKNFNIKLNPFQNKNFSNEERIVDYANI